MWRRSWVPSNVNSGRKIGAGFRPQCTLGTYLTSRGQRELGHVEAGPWAANAHHPKTSNSYSWATARRPLTRPTPATPPAWCLRWVIVAGQPSVAWGPNRRSTPFLAWSWKPRSLHRDQHAQTEHNNRANLTEHAEGTSRHQHQASAEYATERRSGATAPRPDTAPLDRALRCPSAIRPALMPATRYGRRTRGRRTTPCDQGVEPAIQQLPQCNRDPQGGR